MLALSLFAAGGCAGAVTGRLSVLSLLAMLLSLAALAVPVRSTVPAALGVKVSVQLFKEEPAASDTEVAGQPLVVAPGGRVPLKLQLASVATAVALGLLVQVSVQLTLLPAIAGFGLQLIDEVRSDSGATATVIF